MDDDGVIVGMILGAILMMFLAVVLSLVFDIANAGPNGQCDAIGGEYVGALDKCVVDDNVVPLPGDSE
jgi:hypothetical protein